MADNETPANSEQPTSYPPRLCPECTGPVGLDGPHHAYSCPADNETPAASEQPATDHDGGCMSMIEATGTCDCAPEDRSAASEQPVSAWDLLGIAPDAEPPYRTSDRPAASEDVIEQAARTICDSANETTSFAELPSEHYRDLYRSQARALAARGLLAGQDHARIENALALHRPDRGQQRDPDGRCFECGQAMPCLTRAALTEETEDQT